jgi:hypothetical protein
MLRLQMEQNRSSCTPGLPSLAQTVTAIVTAADFGVRFFLTFNFNLSRNYTVHNHFLRTGVACYALRQAKIAPLGS